MRLDFTHYLHMTINYFSGTFRAIALEDTLQLACHTDFLQQKKKGTSVGLCCMMQYGCSDADASIKEDTV